MGHIEPGKVFTISHSVLDEVGMERGRQDEKWGPQNHPDLAEVFKGETPDQVASGYFIPTAGFAKCMCESDFDQGYPNWAAVLIEELAESIEQAALGDTKELRKELIQVAAVAVAWVEAIDRRKS